MKGVAASGHDVGFLTRESMRERFKADWAVNLGHLGERCSTTDSVGDVRREGPGVGRVSLAHFRDGFGPTDGGAADGGLGKLIAVVIGID